MSDEPQITVKTFAMPDTGLGREAGYDSDEAMVEAVRAERARLPDDERKRIEDAERATTVMVARAFVFGGP